MKSPSIAEIITISTEDLRKERRKIKKQVKALKVEPGKHPEAVTLGTTLEELQAAVGGYIEFVMLEEGVSVLCNEEGKLIGLEGNRSLGEDILVGTFFVVGENVDGELVDLPDAMTDKYEKFFHEPETFTREQIEKSIVFRFCEWD